MNILIVENKLPVDRNDRWWEKNIGEICHYDVINVFPDYNLSNFYYIKSGEFNKYIKTGVKLLTYIIKSRYRYDYIISYECGRETFLISLFQTLFLIKKPRHIILDFIMREKSNNLKSRLKYMILKFCLASVHLAVCSSKLEKEYYKNTFKWKDKKVAFIPLRINPELFDIKTNDGNYIFSAGRTFRDYETLIQSLRNINYQTIICAGKDDYEKYYGKIPSNISIYKDLLFEEYINLLANAKFVIIPLQDKIISTGQSVLLHAMALGKMVIVTKTAGSIDYIENGITGVLVIPKSINDMENNILYYLDNDKLIEQIGNRAKLRAYDYLSEIYIKKLYFILGCKLSGG